MVFAEEMDADWSRVSIAYPAVKPEIFGNPIFGGQMVTYGSGSIRGYWDKVRLQAAAVRAVLMQAAADRWQVPLSELHTEPSLVVHAASDRSMSYGEIAGFAQVPATMPVIDKSALKKMADYRILGKNTPRTDIPGKIDGSALYAIDVQVPNMVYATVLRTPVEGGTPEHVDDAAARNVPGVLKVVPLKNSVGVVAETIEAAFKGRSALNVSWSSLPTDTYNSAAGLKDFLAHAAKLDDKGVSYVAKGDADQAFAKAAKVMTAQYSSEYVYHAQMEPMNVTASVSPAGDSAEIWIGTQGVSPNAFAAAAMLKTTPDKIKLNQFYLGGGYGRRSPADMLPEVLPLAKAMQRPVKLIWTREQDVKSAQMRPMTGHQVEAALDADGKVTGWRHRVVGESVVAYRGTEKALENNKGLDNIVLEGSKHEYGIPNQSIAYLREKRGIAVAAWRGIGAGYNKFVIEVLHRRDRRRPEQGPGGVPARAPQRRATRASGDQGGRRQIRLGQSGRRRPCARLFLCQGGRDLCGGGRRNLARYQDRHRARASLLARARSGHRAQSRQRLGADRRQRDLRLEPDLEGTGFDFRRAGAAEQFLRLPGAAHVGNAGDRHPADADRQSGQRHRRSFAAAGRALRRQCAIQAHRQTLPRAADVAGAGEGGYWGLRSARIDDSA